VLDDEERWLPVAGWEGRYWVSDHGRVAGKRGTLRVEVKDSKHLRVTFYFKGKRFYRLVHVLVAEHFIGPRPDRHLVLHGDGCHSNNHVANLRYGTHAENNADTLAHGTHRTAFLAFCVAGLHEFTPENTGWDKGRRYCRACKRERQRKKPEILVVEPAQSLAPVLS
jgi:hypothetical protein